MRRFGAVAAAGVIALSGVALPAANAYDHHDLNNAHIVNYKPVYKPGEPIEVTADNLEPNTKYLVGQCTWTSYKAFFVAWIPACTKQEGTVAVTDANGHLSATINAIETGANVHDKIPFNGGQPPFVNYDYSAAEVVIIKDHGQGFRGSQAADSAETFNVRG